MEAVLGFLPYLLLFLLCPLMMLFMHRGGAHDGHGDQTPGRTPPSTATRPRR